MAEKLQIVQLSASNEVEVLLNLNDEVSFFLESKSFKVIPGARTAIVAQDERRWGGGRQVGEVQENNTVGWTACVAGSTEQECIEKIETLLAQLAANPFKLWLLWQPPGVTEPTLYEIRETGTWTCQYEWTSFAGAQLCLFEVQVPVGPLACGLPVQVYSNSGLTLPTTISLATIPGDAPAKAEVSIQTGENPQTKWITPGGYIEGVAVNSTYIYMAHAATGYIERALIGGTSLEKEWLHVGGQPNGVAVDGTYIYWTDQETGDVGRAKLAGTSIEKTFITGGTEPRGIAVNSTHIYWTNITGFIGRALLGGTEVKQEWLKLKGSPDGIAINATYIYWTYKLGNVIGRALLGGTEVNENLVTGAASPVGIALTSEYIYWANSATLTIGRATLSGAEASQSSISGLAGQPRGLAINSEYLYWSEGGEAIGRIHVLQNPAIWALLGWAARPVSGLAAAPLGVLDSNQAEAGEGWEKHTESGGYGTELIYGEATHGRATWEVDPATMAPDSFSGELTVEVWARMFVLSSLVTAQVTLSAQPQDGLGYGAARYTDEWGSGGRPVTLPSLSGYRLTRLGTLHLLVNPLAPRIWKLVVEGVAGVAAADWGIDYILVVPSLQRACSPSSKPYNSSYPAFITNVGATVKTIRHNLSALISKPGKNGHPDHGLGGQLLELPPGETDLVVKLSNMVPDSPQISATYDQLSYAGAVTVTVTPRWFLARTA